MRLSSCISFVVLTAFGASQATLAADTKPKYGPQATRLTRSHEYFKKADAADFWALMPYYVHQQTGSACSVASVAMVMNALRAPQDLGSEEQLITQDSLLAKAGKADWKKAVSKVGSGRTLDQLGDAIRASLKAYGFKNHKVTVVHTDDASPATLEALRKALSENEKSARDFIVANFIQGALTGDADVGHIAPIGAYDAAAKKVLILDPDREWYEPYWASDEALLAGMATRDKGAAKSRGYVLIRE